MVKTARAIFYAYFLPIIIVVGILGVIINYYINKYLLFNRYSKPPSIGDSMSITIIDTFGELYILIFAIGSILLEFYIYDYFSGFTLASVIITSIFWIFPIHKFFHICIE